MNALFPLVATMEEFDRIARDESLLRPGALAIARQLDQDALPLERFSDGSLPVYSLGEQLVLKLFPPFDTEEHDREAAVLRALEGRLPIPTPAVHQVGQLEDWGYVLMQRLPGHSLATTWPRIPLPERQKLASQLGEALAVLHRVPAPPQTVVDWPDFLTQQTSSATRRQQARGLPEAWTSQIAAFLEAHPVQPRPTVLLHTEVMREHLLVQETPQGWTLSGLFDFEPALAGDPDYEFASVGLFFSATEPGLLRQVLLSYGHPPEALDADFEARLMAWALLHRYSHLAWYLRRLPPPPGTDTLAGLAAHWWGLR